MQYHFLKQLQFATCAAKYLAKQSIDIVVKTAGPILWSDTIGVECALYIKKDDSYNRRLNDIIESANGALPMIPPSAYNSLDECKPIPFSEKHNKVKSFLNVLPNNDV